MNRVLTQLRRWIAAFKSPRSPVFKLYLLCSGERPTSAPPPTELPAQTTKVLIAPVNSAEQAGLWAQALETNLPDVGARHLVAPVVGGSIYQSKKSVPLGAFHLSRTWQRAEFARAQQFTHVLVESQRAMFGGLLKYDSVREIEALRAHGVSVAAMSHGSDTRDPVQHAKRTPWSPFALERPETAILAARAARVRAEILKLDLTHFVSTPDLLDDLPDAHWCPLVVDPMFLNPAVAVLSSDDRPVVTHIPSRGWLKGSELVHPVAHRLGERGLISYRPLENVPRKDMPSAIMASDILLEQFRIGSYGATAVEAMAAGRVVVGHILPAVRDHVRNATGLDLPIVEATGDTLADVLEQLSDDQALIRDLGLQGREFVAQVHSGKLSAEILQEYWLDAEPNQTAKR